jgi:hypothetical protein
MNPEVPETLWTIEDVAAWLRVTPLAVRAMHRRREFPPGSVLKLGRRVRFRAEVVKAWILKQQTA